MTQDELALVATKIAKKVSDSDVLGVGTGSTVNAAIKAISERVKAEKLSVKVVPTSYQTGWLCQEQGLSVISPSVDVKLSWGFDGIDEVDKKLRAIKGGGAALLQEKIMAVRCPEYLFIGAKRKLVNKLGESFAVPVEVVPEALRHVVNELKNSGAEDVELRQATAKAGPVISEGGNLIVDARFSEISDTLEKELNTIVGVVENGIFTDYASSLIIGDASSVEVLYKE